MKVLIDIDKMPFGKYKGKPMQDVPADYFHYLWTNDLKHKVLIDPVAAYIKHSMSALKQEFPDGVWD